MKTTKSSKRNMFTPTAWQWDPMSLTTERVQFWTEGGSMSLVGLDKARELVRNRAAFVGSCQHVCQVHDRIDGANA